MSIIGEVPAPSVRSRPARIAASPAWSAPQVRGSGQVTVHRDVLRGVAASMRSDLRDLDRAVGRLSAARRATSSIRGWHTAVAFSGNAANAYHGVMQASQQTGNAHQDASSRVADSAATYDQVEADNRRAIYSVGTHLDGMAAAVASYGSGRRPGASAAIGGVTSAGYPVKTNAVSPATGAGMSAAQIMGILHRLDPGALQDAGEAHTNLGTTLDRVAAGLARNAHTLAENWSGTAAQAAMGQFQQLHDHTATLARQARQVGSVLTWLGRDVLPAYKTLPDPSASAAPSAGGGQSAADSVARGYIKALSDDLVTANNALPEMIGTGSSRGGDGSPNRGGSAGGTRSPGSAGAAGSALLAPGAGLAVGAGFVPGGGAWLAGGASPSSVGTLQSAPVSGGTAGPSPAGPPGSSLPGASGPGAESASSQAAGVPSVPELPVPGPAALAVPGVTSADAPPSSWAVAGTPVGPGPGAAASGAAADSAVADSAAGTQALGTDGSLGAAGPTDGAVAPGMAAVPMTGAGAGPQERDRQRQAWLNEEEDIWGLPTDLIPPVIEGGG